MNADFLPPSKPIVLNNNTYQIILKKNDGETNTVYFLWGKIDFRCSYRLNADGAALRNLKIKRNGNWYDYVKISSHGIFFEETYWKNNAGDVYIKLPPKYKQTVVGMINAFEEKT